MHFSPCIAIIVAYSVHHVDALARRAPSRVAITSHVLPLVAAPHSYPYPITPSSKYLHKRNKAKRANAILSSPNSTTEEDEALAPIQQSVLTLGGRVYMTNITLSSPPRSYTVVIDTGSSDTWLASSSFQCVSRFSRTPLAQATCGFGELFDVEDSSTYTKIPTHDFGVAYTDGEFLTGEMGTEVLGVGGQGLGERDVLVERGVRSLGTGEGLSVRQTIGVVEQGWWMGDSVSSGLMGLAYSGIASNAGDLNYTSVIFSLFEDGSIPPIFSLALSRPTTTNPVAGGLLAIGGIPDIPHDGAFVSVPIHPIVSDKYAFYSIPVDGFSITAPPNTSTTRAHRTQHTKDSASSAFATQNLDMVIDSGSTLLSLPDTVADRIASLFSPPATYTASTNTYTTICGASAPRVGVIIAGKTFWIHEDDLMNKAPGAVGGGGGDVGSGQEVGWCTVAVQRQLGGDAVLGDTWLKNVLAVFDLGGNLMRFSGREGY